jgi:hypothetical protein
VAQDEGPEFKPSTAKKKKRKERKKLYVKHLSSQISIKTSHEAKFLTVRADLSLSTVLENPRESYGDTGKV